MTLHPDAPGMSAASEVTYTYARTLGPAVLHEVACDYEMAAFSGGTVGGTQWTITVRRKCGEVIGVTAGAFDDAMKQAQGLAEADAMTHGAVELPPICGPLVRVRAAP